MNWNKFDEVVPPEKDRFATSEVNQARALADVLNLLCEGEGLYD